MRSPGSKVEVGPDFFTHYNSNLAYNYAHIRSCEEEPIRFPAAIQPLGYVLSCDDRTLRITSISQNLLEELDYIPDELFSKGIGLLLKTELGGEIDHDFLEKQQLDPLSRILLKRRDDNFSQIMMANISFARGQCIIELEPCEDEINPLFLNSQHTKLLSQRFEDCKETVHLARELSAHIQFIVGFERVLVYQFDANWCGEVIAENSTVDCESFLGLKFPDTDIPAQARALYLKGKSRCISDTKMLPVSMILSPSLVPHDLDLSDCVLRASSSIHIRYLHNMGLRSSYSIPIIVNQVLWGIVSCHQFSTAKHPTYSERHSCELSARLLTAKVLELAEGQRMREQKKVSQFVETVSPSGTSSLDFFDSLSLYAISLGEMIESSGIYIKFGDQILTKGTVPSDRQQDLLLQHLSNSTGYAIWKSHCLQKDLGNEYGLTQEGNAFNSEIAGALAIPLSPGFGDSIIWFRKEQIQNVKWGGQSTSISLPDTSLIDYSPRQSFLAWTQTVVNESTQWTMSEIDCAHFLLFGLLKNILAKTKK